MRKKIYNFILKSMLKNAEELDLTGKQKSQINGLLQKTQDEESYLISKLRCINEDIESYKNELTAIQVERNKLLKTIRENLHCEQLYMHRKQELIDSFLNGVYMYSSFDLRRIGQSFNELSSLVQKYETCTKKLDELKCEKKSIEKKLGID